MDDAWNERLSEYLDDELSQEERGALESHVQTCLRCRADLESLRTVTARARTLRDVPPDADLWPGIATRIERGTGSGGSAERGNWGAGELARKAPARSPGPRRFSFTLPQLVAAGLALVVLSGGMVWLARLGGPRTDFPPVAAESNVSDRLYEEAVADLRRTLDAERSALDPETEDILEASLQEIDGAIAQCRAALEDDPSNVYLNTYLAQARGRKLSLLKHANAIVNKHIARQVRSKT